MDIFYSRVHSLNNRNSHVWVRSNPEVQNSIQVSTGGRDPRTGHPLLPLRVHTVREVELGMQAGWNPETSATGSRCLKRHIT